MTPDNDYRSKKRKAAKALGRLGEECNGDEAPLGYLV